MAQASPFIFIAWDSSLRVGTTLEDLVDLDPPEGVTFSAVGYRQDDPHVGELREQLVSHINNADAVLAIVDRPNAYVGWEIGYAWGHRVDGRPARRLALVRSGGAGEPPAWIRSGPLRGQLAQGNGVGRASLLAAAEALDRWAEAPGPCTKGDRSLLLCPGRGQGEPLVRNCRKRGPTLEHLDLHDVSLAALPEHLAGAGRALWVVPEPSEDQERDADETAQLAIAAGYLRASGVPVVLLRHAQARDVDHLPCREPFGSIQAFLEQVHAWEQATRVRAGSGGIAPASADPIAAWRGDVRSEHAELLPFVRELGHRLLQRIPVEIELERSDEHACLEAGDAGPEGCLGARALLRGPGQALPLRRLIELHLSSTRADEHAGRWLVVAEPGAGKTTLARHLAWELAGEGDEAPVPLFVPLASLAERDEHPFTWAGRTLAVDQGLQGAGALEAELFEASLIRGRVWLLLDGLDEVPSGRLEDCWRRIGRWADELPGVELVVLTRPVAAHHERPLPQGFCRVAVRYLDQPRQRALLASMLEPQLAERVADELLCQPQLALLARNPLLLTLLAIVAEEAWSQGGAPPSHRLELYERAVTLFLERGWGRRRAKVKDVEPARRLLQALALHLQAAGGEAWTPAELSEALSAVRREDPGLNFDLKETWGSNDTFLADIDTNAGLLGSRDGRRAPWRFLHRSFREFLAAQVLVRRSVAARMELVTAGMPATSAGRPVPDVREARDRFATRWGEVVAMLCGLVPEHEARDLLSTLEEAAPELASRALPTLDGFGPIERVGLLARLLDRGDDDLRFGQDELAAMATGLRVFGPDGERQLLAEAQHGASPLSRGLAAGLLPPAVGEPLYTRLGADSGAALVRGLPPSLGWLAARLCRELRGLEPWAQLELLVGIEGRHGFSAWDNDDLDAVLAALGRRGDEPAQALWSRVTTGRSPRELGLLWYAIEGLGVPADPERFFGACGLWERPRPSLPYVAIPAGEFLMGSPEGEGGQREHPRHRVHITQPFRLGTTPVTNAQYRAFDAEHRGRGGDGHSATEVDWLTARLFAAWVGGRLPLEGEWEYACRAGTQAPWSCPEEELGQHAWFSENSEHEVHPVAGKKPNPWGLHDMHGNVWEWTACRWVRSYAEGAVEDPVGPSSGPGRVIRGGSYWLSAGGCRSAVRSRSLPGVRVRSLGFRVAWSPSRG